jgi:hypothetical protein
VDESTHLCAAISRHRSTGTTAAFHAKQLLLGQSGYRAARVD